MDTSGKDYRDMNINIEPLAKLRNQLARRHSAIFGMFFSMTDYTAPAQMLIQFMAPQLIILWTREDLDYCFHHEICFTKAMLLKYKMAIEKCEYNLNLSTYYDKELLDVKALI